MQRRGQEWNRGAPDAIAPVLASTLRSLEPTLVIAPFGLANPDHDVTHRACMSVHDTAALDDEVSWWCYEDTYFPKAH